MSEPPAPKPRLSTRDWALIVLLAAVNFTHLLDVPARADDRTDALIHAEQFVNSDASLVADMVTPIAAHGHRHGFRSLLRGDPGEARSEFVGGALRLMARAELSNQPLGQNACQR